MTDTLFGFPVQSDGESELSNYSRNRLANGDAESGDISPWKNHLVTVVPGGVDGSAFVFKVEGKVGEMSQVIPLGGAQAPDYKVIGRFLPDDVITDVATQVNIYGKVLANYAVGEADEHYLPVMEPMAYKPEGA